MAQKVVKLSVVDGDQVENARDDFDAMLEMTGVEADTEQDEILGEFEAEFAASHDEAPAAAPQFSSANQWPVSQAEFRMIERITHRKGSRPIGMDALKSKLEPRLDPRGNFIEYKPTDYNITQILQNDPRTHGALELDLFTGTVRLAKAVRFSVPGVANLHCKPGGEPFSDEHESALMTWIGSPVSEGGWGISPRSEAMSRAIRNAARQNGRHPIYEVITSRPWDGVARLDAALERWLKLSPRNRAYNHAVSRNAFVALVARLMEAGHKFDFMPVIQGLAQGSAKSSLLSEIGLGYFGEINEPRQITDAKLLNEATAGKWVIELPELAAIMGVNSSAVKAKLSSKSDRARGAYAKHTEERERSFVFFGTSNPSMYLQDPTGNRRFWPLAVGVSDRNPIDLELVRSEIQQVYAEALAVYRQMRVSQPHGDLPLFLKDEAADIAKRLQGEAAVETPEKTIADWLTDWLARPACGEDGEHADIVIGGDRYISAFCANQAFRAYHAAMGADRVPDYDRKAQLLMGQAIQLLAGVSEGNKKSFQKFGRPRTYYVDSQWLGTQVQPDAGDWRDAVVADLAKDADQTVSVQHAPSDQPKAVVVNISAARKADPANPTSLFDELSDAEGAFDRLASTDPAKAQHIRDLVDAIDNPKEPGTRDGNAAGAHPKAYASKPQGDANADWDEIEAKMADENRT